MTEPTFRSILGRLAVQAVWEECVDAICPLCREVGWPINDEKGNLFHVHESFADSKPCLADALFRIKSRDVHGAVNPIVPLAALMEKLEALRDAMSHQDGMGLLMKTPTLHRP